MVQNIDDVWNDLTMAWCPYDASRFHVEAYANLTLNMMIESGTHNNNTEPRRMFQQLIDVKHVRANANLGITSMDYVNEHDG